MASPDSFDGANLMRPKGDLRPGFHDERTCVVKNLPLTWTEDIFQQEFAPFQPTGVFIVTKRKDVGSERIGFVGFQGREWAIDARSSIDKSHGVSVTLATPRISQHHNTNVYVSGVPMAFNEAWFTKLCSQFGEVLESKLLTQIAARNEMATLSGFARYASLAQSDSAIANLHSAVVVPPRHLLRRGQEPKPHVLTARYATNAKNNTPLAAAQGVWFPQEYTRGIITPRNPRLEQDISQQLLLRFVVEGPDAIPGGPTCVIPSDHSLAFVDDSAAVSGPDTSVDGLVAIEAWKKQLQVYKKGETLPPQVVDAASKSNEPNIVGYVERAARRIPGTDFLSPAPTAGRAGGTGAAGSAVPSAPVVAGDSSAASLDGQPHGGSTATLPVSVTTGSSSGPEGSPVVAQDGHSVPREWRSEVHSGAAQGGPGASGAAPVSAGAGGPVTSRPAVTDAAGLEQRFASLSVRGSGASPSPRQHTPGAASAAAGRAFASNKGAAGQGQQVTAPAAAGMLGAGMTPYPVWPGMPPPGAPLFDAHTGLPLHPMAHMPPAYAYAPPYGMQPGYMHPAYADPAYAAHMMQQAHLMYSAGGPGGGAPGMPDPRFMYPYGYPPPYAGMPGPYPMPGRGPPGAAGSEGLGSNPGMPPGPALYYAYASPEGGLAAYGAPGGYRSTAPAGVTVHGEGQAAFTRTEGAPGPGTDQQGQSPHGYPMPPYSGYAARMPPSGARAPAPHAMYRGAPEPVPYPYDHNVAAVPPGVGDAPKEGGSGAGGAVRDRSSSSSVLLPQPHAPVSSAPADNQPTPVPAHINKAREAALMAMCFAAESRGEGGEGGTSSAAGSRGTPKGVVGKDVPSASASTGRTAYSSSSLPSDPLLYKWPPGVVPTYESSSPAVPLPSGGEGGDLQGLQGAAGKGGVGAARNGLGSLRLSSGTTAVGGGTSMSNDEISALIAAAPGGSVILSNFGRRGNEPAPEQASVGPGSHAAAQPRSSPAASSIHSLASDVQHDSALATLPSLPDLPSLSELGLGESSLGRLGVGTGTDGGLDSLFLGLGAASDSSQHAGMDFELLASQLLDMGSGSSAGGGRQHGRGTTHRTTG